MNKKISALFLFVISAILIIVYINHLKSENRKDFVLEELTDAARNTQSIWARPQMMGGAGKDFNNLNEIEILREVFRGTAGFEAHNESISNNNGIYTLEIISSIEIAFKGVTKNEQHEVKARVKRNNETEEWDIEFKEDE